MGSGTQAPGQVTTRDILGESPKKNGHLFAQRDYTLPGGKMFLDEFIKEYQTGLPQNIKDIYLKQGKQQIGNNLREGQQQLKQGLASTGGNVPIDALISGQNKLQTSANNSLTQLADKYAMMNYDAKNSAFGKYANLIGLATGQGQEANNFNMNRYSIDKQNEFNWGDALGAGLGVGGQIAGGAIARKK